MTLATWALSTRARWHPGRPWRWLHDADPALTSGGKAPDHSHCYPPLRSGCGHRGELPHAARYPPARQPEQGGGCGKVQGCLDCLERPEPVRGVVDHRPPEPFGQCFGAGTHAPYSSGGVAVSPTAAVLSTGGRKWGTRIACSQTLNWEPLGRPARRRTEAHCGRVSRSGHQRGHQTGPPGGRPSQREQTVQPFVGIRLSLMMERFMMERF